ncbi:hypothetical protein SESBI_31408 [Sesbania bispinosa]|nr:hypothetical protein SESBI_31408 [Sesbania bispinosa]
MAASPVWKKFSYSFSPDYPISSQAKAPPERYQAALTIMSIATSLSLTEAEGKNTRILAVFTHICCHLALDKMLKDISNSTSVIFRKSLPVKSKRDISVDFVYWCRRLGLLVYYIENN